MVAIVGLIPERQLGVVIFANRDHAELRHSLMYTVFDRYLGNSKHDWNREMLAMYTKLREDGKKEERQVDSAHVLGTSPSLPLARYAGVYADSLYGTAAVKLEGKKLVVSFGPLSVADLDHWHYDSFMAHWRDAYRGRQLMSFRLADDGTVAGLAVGDDVFLRRVAVKP
jgi:hypothetical protein